MSTAVTITTVGALLLAGLLADALARRTPLPRVTLLLLLGLLAGPAVLDLLPPGRDAWFTVSANIALVMIGFLLGGEFTHSHVKELERVVFSLALIESVTAAAVVGAGLLIMGSPAEVALSLAGIGAATAPAPTSWEGRTTGSFSTSSGTDTRTSARWSRSDRGGWRADGWCEGGSGSARSTMREASIRSVRGAGPAGHGRCIDVRRSREPVGPRHIRKPPEP